MTAFQHRTLLDHVVYLADADRDGRLNEQEYLWLRQTWYDAGESYAIEAFRRLDRDGDGFLILDELVHSATDFYLDNDPILTSLPSPRR